MKTIKETTELFDFAKASVEAVRASRADGTIDFRDAGNFLNPAFKLPAAIGGIKEIPAELSDLDGREINELEAQFGDIVHDDRYRRAFAGLVVFADAVYEIATSEPAKS